jgi:hypothetical protein
MKKWFFIVIAISCSSWMIRPSAESTSNAEFASMINDYVRSHYKQNFSEYIYVSVRYQKIYMISDTNILISFPVSTALKGTGSQIHSEKTPLGLHRITHKLGEEAPVGGIIGPTGYTGKQISIFNDSGERGKDEVTTRALRLEGMEAGKNKGGENDSFIREIYIHGTPDEHLIGQPVSHGCVRMKNQDIIQLFGKVSKGMYVLILPY